MSRGRLLGLSAAAALALVLAWLVRVDPGPAEWTVPEAAPAVQALVLDTASRRIGFERRAGRWVAWATVAVSPESAGPAYGGVAAPTTDEVTARLDWVLDRLCQRPPVLTLPAAEVSGAQFGLEKPAVRLTIRASRTYHLDLGASNPAGDGRYFRLPDLGRAGLLRRDLAGEIEALAGCGPNL
ncbi:MAG: hypothetical protein HY814_13490 [Candidatus Riflebacteria bacterium]|nr:hypothetical protein [Candidatus Riflebacteria bacterium]